ncbi:MAG TPA: hypothetical protein VD966_10455, partial [Pyrinomonadaceae bacterium]|nr:hypothetical protein [Pyrinomonadaceae bacterium]
MTSVNERRRPRLKVVGRAARRGAQSATLPKRKIIFRSILLSSMLALGAVIAFLIYSYISYSRIVDARLANGYLTSHAGIYAAPRLLRVGQALSLDGLVLHLRRAGYIETDASDVWSGSFNAQGE